MSLRRILLSLGVLVAGGLTAADGQNMDKEKVAETMSFEDAASWVGTPPDLPEMMYHYNITERDLWCAQEIKDSTWDLKSIRLSELSSALKLSDKNVKDGKYSGYWKDLPDNPTIATFSVEKDWSSYKAMSFWVYVPKATGDVITLGVRSDNFSNTGRGYYFAQFTLDKQGWMQVTIPLDKFVKQNNPYGWDNVNGIYFFARAFGTIPNPYTQLYLDKITLEKDGIEGKNFTLPNLTGVKREDGGFLYEMLFKDCWIPQLNHNYPERSTSEPVVTPLKMITHQSYYKGERAQFKYYPKYNPGFPSYDAKGKTYVISGDKVQYRDAAGKWQVSDLKPALLAWGKSNGWKGMYVNWGSQGAEPVIRFDNDGDGYVLMTGEALDAKAKRYDWKSRFAVLMHSNDGLKSWKVYKLPGRMADIEKLDAHNRDCLKRPPVITVHDYAYFGNADKRSFLVLPEKKADGTLDISNTINLGSDLLLGNYHSGAGNVIITSGDNVYVSYGWCPDNMAHKKLFNELRVKTGETRFDHIWTLSNIKGTDLVKTMPPMPENNPAYNFIYYNRNHLPYGSNYFKHYSYNGVPTYIVAYNLKTKKLSAPVYIGSGGGDIDPHNWSALSLDSKGYLHAIINGHHSPAAYTRTVRPNDISEWIAAEYINVGTTMPNVSYGSLNCDKDNTLYAIFRSTKDTYNNRLCLYRKKEGQPWEPEHSLVAPFKRLYYVWYHHVTYNPGKDGIMLTYYSQSGQTYMSRDMYEFLVFQRPEQEPLMLDKMRKNPPYNLPLVNNRFWGSWENGAMFNPIASEITTLITTDKGDNWTLAVSDDL